MNLEAGEFRPVSEQVKQSITEVHKKMFEAIVSTEQDAQKGGKGDRRP